MLKKCWWNCWLAHSWSPWSEPKAERVVTTYVWNVSSRDTMVQERYCGVCNQRELRRAA